MFDLQHEMRCRDLQANSPRGGVAPLRPYLLRQEYLIKRLEMLEQERLAAQQNSENLTVSGKSIKHQIAQSLRWIGSVIIARREASH